MKLKKVEIKGFKSFALKTEVQIKEGITAIVGPNGSGKSNISDAIRWVLGEQSIKNLRGNKMEDVIFAGTSNRKPLGYCEVSITFDNKDSKIPVEYDEVEVTRRMFRSGESQYYLNKSSCRLKDIREIFMDTGIGKDGYSIIGQGRIEEILSNKPEDRRSIFEEAAGIVKYKSKKIEAERKLEKTENNIIRIKDLVHELSKQLETLEVQASKAKEFNILYKELKELEVSLIVMDIKKSKKQKHDINEEKLAFENKLNEIKKEEKTIEEKFYVLKKNINEIEDEIEKCRNANLDLINKCERDRNELAVINEKETFYQKDLQRIISEKERTNKKLDELEILNNDLSEHIKIKTEQYEEILMVYNENKTQLNKETDTLSKKEKEIEDRKNNILNTYNETSDIKSKLNSISSFNESISKRIEQLNKEITEFHIQKDKNESLYKTKIQVRDKAEKELCTLKEKLTNLIKQFNKEKEKLINVNDAINKIELKKQSKLSSLRILQGMEEDYEGYYKGVKSILIEAKNNPTINKGLIGIVAEMLKVSNEYEKAIEISLGSSGQNIVTHNEQDAKVIIEYLKKNKLGRVTCLPLNVIKGKEIKLNEKDKDEFNILGLGHEVIEYDKKYENIFKYLLGRTIIIKDIDSAIKFANKSKHIYRIVTLTGEVLNPGGSMTGGSHKGNSINIINRKNRIEDAKIDIEEIKLEIEKLKKQQNEYTHNIEKWNDEISKFESEIKNSEYEIYNYDNDIKNYKDEQLRINNIINKANKEIIELKKEENEYKLEYESLNKKLSSIEKSSIEEKENIKKLMLIYNKEKEEREDKSQHILDLKLKINEAKNNIKNLEEKLSGNEVLIQDLLIELQEKNNSIVLNEEEIEKMKLNKENLKKSIEELEEKENETKQALDKLSEVKSKSMNDFYLEQDNLTNINKAISTNEKKVSSLDVKLARISAELDNYQNKLLEEYELTFEQASKEQIEIADIQKAIIQARKLKVKIKELGNVNLSSIEEHKILNDRLEFILNQQNDLMEAKENLNNIISDMENKMKTQFLLNFKKINENFINVFKILFNGGKAELVLEDENDILNSGIQINAQPPGKKLQSLTLLSGGEKSLTAVALLFSILTLRPAPFCILDEIDAALDEANISKYTAYLKNFSYDTQFVLITHRKTTMEIADNLYGVTMEESGISKLISVKLKDYVKEIAS